MCRFSEFSQPTSTPFTIRLVKSGYRKLAHSAAKVQLSSGVSVYPEPAMRNRYRSATAADERYPSFFPDGNQIAFRSEPRWRGTYM
jgi:hypothetical protein